MQNVGRSAASAFAFCILHFAFLCRRGGSVSRLTAEELDALRQIDSPTISNAIEQLGVRGRLDGFAGWELRCAFPERKTMLGYAVTCTADSTTESRRDERGLLRLWQAGEAAPKPVGVV